MSRFIVLILGVITAFILTLQPVPVIEAYTQAYAIVSGINGPTCQMSQMQVEVLVVADINDGGTGFDNVIVEIVDANGVILYYFMGSTPFGTTENFIGTFSFLDGVPTARPFVFRAYDADASFNILEIDAEIVFDPVAYGISSCAGLPYIENNYGLPAYIDGRLCLWDDYAVYTDNDSIDVYGIKNSKGYLVASVSQSDLDAHPGSAGTNTLISEQRGIMFYRLGDSDVYQVHVGPYVSGLSKFVRFTGLPAEDIFCGVVR